MKMDVNKLFFWNEIILPDFQNNECENSDKIITETENSRKMKIAEFNIEL